MKIALLSDIHGNSVGLTAVLDAIDARGDIDVSVAAGDLIGGGAGCGDLLDLLVERGVEMIIGNSEQVFLDPDRFISNIPEKYRAYIRVNNSWMQERMTREHRALLESLPISKTYESEWGHRILVCHAVPGDAWRRVCSYDNSAETLRDAYGRFDAEVIAYGHFHGNHVTSIDGKLLANVASVGFRTDGRSCFTIIDCVDGRVSVLQQSVEYDVEEERRLNQLEGVPGFFSR